MCLGLVSMCWASYCLDLRKPNGVLRSQDFILGFAGNPRSLCSSLIGALRMTNSFPVAAGEIGRYVSGMVHNVARYNDISTVDCSLCSERVPREEWSAHKGEKCPQRMVTCEYCEFPLPAVDLFKHQETCGNRTDYCQICSKYIRLRERINHEIQFHSNANGSAESSRWPEREGPHRRPARDASRGKKILVTIAITGMAVLLGSIFLQRRVDTLQQQ